MCLVSSLYFGADFNQRPQSHIIWPNFWSRFLSDPRLKNCSRELKSVHIFIGTLVVDDIQILIINILATFAFTPHNNGSMPCMVQNPTSTTLLARYNSLLKLRIILKMLQLLKI